MHIYTHTMRVHLIIRQCTTHSLHFLQMFDVTALVTLQMSHHPFLKYVCEHVHVEQTECTTDSWFEFKNRLRKWWTVNLIFYKTIHKNLRTKGLVIMVAIEQPLCIINPNYDFSTKVRSIYQQTYDSIPVICHWTATL